MVAGAACMVRCDSLRRLNMRNDEWITVEFLGGPLDGALRPVQRTVAVYYLASGAVIHAYALNELWDGQRMRQVMRHLEIVHCASRFA